MSKEGKSSPLPHSSLEGCSSCSVWRESGRPCLTQQGPVDFLVPVYYQQVKFFFA